MKVVGFSRSIMLDIGLLQVQEWFDKAAKFTEMANAVKRLRERLVLAENRSLLYELYPYVWDISGVISLLHSYIKWLGEYTIYFF